MLAVISWWVLDGYRYFLLCPGWLPLFPTVSWMVTVISYCVLDGYRYFLMGHGWLPYFSTIQILAPCAYCARYSLKASAGTLPAPAPIPASKWALLRAHGKRPCPHTFAGALIDTFAGACLGRAWVPVRAPSLGCLLQLWGLTVKTKDPIAQTMPHQTWQLASGQTQRGNISAPGIFCDPCPTGGLLLLICWATLYGFAP